MRRGKLAQTERNPWQLTNGELAVVRLVCQGLSSLEICQAMVISPRTFQSHLWRIFQKVGVSDRVGLIVEVLHQPQAREFCFPDLAIGERDGTDRADRTDGRLHRSKPG